MIKIWISLHVKGNVILYGRDFDITSGPESATWIDSNTGNNPYFLSSPGFQGTVPCDFELVYVDTSTGVEIDPQPDVLDETTVSYYHQLKVTLKNFSLPMLNIIFILLEMQRVALLMLSKVEPFTM